MRKLDRVALAACLIVGLLSGLCVMARADDAAPAGPPPGRILLQHFQFDAGADHPRLYGRFWLVNQTGTVLQHVKVQVHLRDENGKDVPDAVVDASPINDEQEDFMPAQVFDVGRHHAYQWRWEHAHSGSVYAAPAVTVTGTYGDNKDFSLLLRPGHPNVAAH